MQEAEIEIPSRTDAVKRCRRCGMTKLTSEFYRDRTQPDGWQKYCIPCRREQKGITQRQRAARAKLEAEEAERLRFKAAWERIRNPRNKGWAERVEEKRQAWVEERKLAKIIAHRKKVAKWQKSNPEKVREKTRRYIKKHPDRCKGRNDRWARETRDKVAARKRRYAQSKRHCPLFQLAHRIRTTTREAFKRKKLKKKNLTIDMLGCSWEILKQHIEKQFTKGMNWKNMSKWHIDHIVPLASARDADELIALAHFTNLRPLWAEENMAKGDSIVTCQPELILCIR